MSCSRPQFCHPWGIAPKISKDLPGILATPLAKFHANQWSFGEENRDWRKKSKCISKMDIPPYGALFTYLLVDSKTSVCLLFVMTQQNTTFWGVGTRVWGLWPQNLKKNALDTGDAWCQISRQVPVETRKLHYRKDDRMVRLIYECPESFWESLTTPMDIFPKLFWCAFVLIDSMNVHRKFEICSLSHSWDNSNWSFC